MKDRLSALMRDKGLSANKFAEMIEVQPSGLSHIINGRNKPGYDFIIKTLSVFPDVSPDWLLLGKGNIYRHCSDTEKEQSREADFPIGNDSHDSKMNDNQTHCDNNATIQKHGINENNNELSYSNTPDFGKKIPSQRILLLNDDNKTAVIYHII